MIAGLAGAKTRGGKAFFCRQLVMVGTEAAVPELAKLLTDPETSHIARYALARLPGTAADAALLQALDKADDKLQVGIVNSLGTRGCVAAVDKIAALLGSSNQDLVIAALAALGRIDSEAAVAAVAKARGSVPARLKTRATDAYLDCAARLVKQDKAEAALAIYRQLYAPDEPTVSRIAALIGMVAVQKEQATALALAALGDKDPQVRRVAIPTLRAIPGETVTRAVVAALAGQDADGQVMLLSMLADRGDPTALAAIVKATDSATPAVRIAALNACAAVGDTTVVTLLLQRAAESPEAAEQQAARNSLNLLRGSGINAEVARQFTAGKAAVRVEVARALAARRAADQLPALLRAVEEQEPPIAGEALKSLRSLATPEHLPALLKLLAGAKDNGVRGEAESTVVAVAKTLPDNQDQAAAVLAVLPQAREPGVRACGHSRAGPDRPRRGPARSERRAPGRNPRGQGRRRAGAGRVAYRGPGPGPPRDRHRCCGFPVHRVLALRGYVNLIAKQTDASDEQILEDYARAIELATPHRGKAVGPVEAGSGPRSPCVGNGPETGGRCDAEAIRRGGCRRHRTAAGRAGQGHGVERTPRRRATRSTRIPPPAGTPAAHRKAASGSASSWTGCT